MKQSVRNILLILSIPITVLGNGLGKNPVNSDSTSQNNPQDSLKIEKTTYVYSSLSAGQIENIATRSISDFISLQPGVVLYNKQIFLRGGRSDETAYQIERAFPQEL